ncbi:hypothetical protein J2Z83_001080 [Virgibacillus natechei]|uniref:Histidine kinase n=1 Tax=Virgibacillus natechei TaxID=1216297 RepID=A0ABS4IDF7_9BACI|nr:hypothetical protein [Virgibacillus natechei]
MIIFFGIFGLIVLIIFNLLNDKFCMTMEMEAVERKKFFRVMNIMTVILLINGYIRISNLMV